VFSELDAVLTIIWKCWTSLTPAAHQLTPKPLLCFPEETTAAGDAAGFGLDPRT